MAMSLVVTSASAASTVGSVEDSLRNAYLSSPEFIAHMEADPAGAEAMLEKIIEDTLAARSGVAPYMDNDVRAWVNLTLIQQDGNTYCGPANVLMAIKGWGGTVPGSTTDAQQAYLAGIMGTDSTGTYVYRVRDCLNSYLSYMTYSYYQGAELSTLQFRSYIYNSLAHDRAPLLHARTKYLSYYNGHSTGHYITIGSYDSSTMEVTLYDSHPNDLYYGIHTVSYLEAYDSIASESGRYLIVNW